MSAVWLQVVVVVLAGAGDRARHDEPLDAALTSSGGGAVRLSEQLGLPTVLFYEDRHSAAINQETKDELLARGRERGLLKVAKVVAVANLKDYDWFPAREFALAGVRDAEKTAGIPILVDWSGTLSAAPWSLPSRTSSILVLDPSGRVVFERSGRLSKADRAELFEVLGRLIVSASGAERAPRSAAR